MFIIIQFPFVDLRMLQKQDSKQYFFPNKFRDHLGKKVYYRHLGAKQYRHKHDGLPQSEHCYFDAQKILKLDSEKNFDCKLVFARLFTDEFFFHFDIGIRVTNDKSTKIDVLAYVERLLEENIFISPKYLCYESSIGISSMQKYIAALYIYATTYINNYKKNSDTEDLYFGKPAIYCQTNTTNYLLKTKAMYQVDYSKSIFLYKTTHISKSGLVHIWFLKKKDTTGETKDTLRRLRICLLKLHNYREGLIGIFQFLEYQTLEEKSINKINCDLILIEFHHLLKLLNRTEHYGINGKEIMNMALKGDRQLNFESWEEHLEKLEYFYRQLKSREEHTKMSTNFNDKVTFIGNTTFIDGNVNTVNNRNTLSDLSYSVNEFEKECQKIINEENIPEDTQKELQNYREQFAKDLNGGKAKRTKLKKTWANIKKVFSSVVTNADKLSVLFSLGEKLANGG